MTTPSSSHAWKMPCTEEPGRLKSMWFQRVIHDWVTEQARESKWMSINSCFKVYCLDGGILNSSWLQSLLNTKDSVHCAQLLSLVLLFVTPWIVVCQAPLSMGFPRQEYRTGLPFLSPGDQGSNLCLLHCGWNLNHWATRFGKSCQTVLYNKCKIHTVRGLRKLARTSQCIHHFRISL